MNMLQSLFAPGMKLKADNTKREKKGVDPDAMMQALMAKQVANSMRHGSGSFAAAPFGRTVYEGGQPQQIPGTYQVRNDLDPMAGNPAMQTEAMGLQGLLDGAVANLDLEGGGVDMEKAEELKNLLAGAKYDPNIKNWFRTPGMARMSPIAQYAFLQQAQMKRRGQK